ncbi:hypothetical protein N781_03115 [Pontibacillus halophilus JSM 076056 = DSM 19796]|uniref:Beta-carotene 15,15-monooxygenase n=1 Tax=Pontibacillus halophilus JSM 076056 = DSM 19796 TaxID=1385510 RepID=A0A0A5GLR0_9BACI|nr:hypothetical protein [Pontibacillus halophilus]KGX92085.1 hypothetical protein N781_03115 [Pontibacillus halophilus JSM 076056 = DSM 19796]
MNHSNLDQQIYWKRIFFLFLLILVPNYLVMQMGITGPVDDRIGAATALDVGIILPLLLYFFGFKKRISWTVLAAFILFGVVLSNWLIPANADGYLSYFTNSVLVLEAAILSLELFLLTIIVKRLPLLIKRYKATKTNRYHFLSSFSVAIEQTFALNQNNSRKIHIGFHILATDLAAIYYSLFSFRQKRIEGFTFHKGGEYLGVFFMLVHAMVIEIIAVHLMVAQYSHLAAWIVTALDIYLLLLIIADYQAIRLSPIVLDETGFHFQKGIREYGIITWGEIEGMYKNTELPKDDAVELAFHGLEKEPPPYIIRLKEPVQIRRFLGKKKVVTAIYVKMDDHESFSEQFNRYTDS